MRGWEPVAILIVAIIGLLLVGETIEIGRRIDWINSVGFGCQQ